MKVNKKAGRKNKDKTGVGLGALKSMSTFRISIRSIFSPLLMIRGLHVANIQKRKASETKDVFSRTFP